MYHKVFDLRVPDEAKLNGVADDLLAIVIPKYPEDVKLYTGYTSSNHDYEWSNRTWLIIINCRKNNILNTQLNDHYIASKSRIRYLRLPICPKWNMVCGVSPLTLGWWHGIAIELSLLKCDAHSAISTLSAHLQAPEPTQIFIQDCVGPEYTDTAKAGDIWVTASHAIPHLEHKLMNHLVQLVHWLVTYDC